jgi:iron-sulfur cluster assembly protein
MALDTEPAADDDVYSFGELRVFVDSMSAPYLRGARVDYVDDALLGQGFKVDNPNATSSCGCGQSFKTEDSPAPTGGGCGSGGCGSH